ncbi:hypothetical protein AN639_03745 [Candidatus Epulonipiscium fishelsonii]|uniref:Uncharacterized protein n=1 Tax=Candidatus Epulonipiscium fishelsonii TaxID=77094 RepID=A0ACC8X7R2_9FIRM|nr:hypothetical protein AN396_12780 [Epulopiscium sp. SCG-B11WGA-EpuloA1]ONI41475.1 hypothetical protein AN639_03745 [Epulopiscium sp. SCG-B05WGA-EpuloA1]
MIYYYYANSIKTNKKIRGQIDCIDRKDAINQLLNVGLNPLFLRKKTIFDISTSLSIHETYLFLYELSNLLQSGISLIETLNIMYQQANSRKRRFILRDIINELNSGKSFSQAIKKLNYFSPFIVSTIHAGESSGNLSYVLDLILQQIQIQIESKKVVEKATLYPKIVLLTLMGIVIVAIKFIFPQFIELFNSYKVDMPFITKLIISIIEFIRPNLVTFIISLYLYFLVMKRINSLYYFKSISEKIKLQFTFYKNLFQLKSSLEFSNLLGILLNAGITLKDALIILEQTISSPSLKKQIKKSVNEIREGRDLSSTLKEQAILSGTLISIIEIGEKSGTLDTMLLNSGKYFEKLYNHKLEKLLIWIEPILTLTLAVIVGIIVLSIMLPTFSLATQII